MGVNFRRIELILIGIIRGGRKVGRLSVRGIFSPESQAPVWMSHWN